MLLLFFITMSCPLHFLAGQLHNTCRTIHNLLKASLHSQWRKKQFLNGGGGGSSFLNEQKYGYLRT